MNFRVSDYDKDDLNEIHHKYSFNESIADEDISKSKNTTPVFCYDLIDLDKTDYHFKQSCFDNVDIQAYFSQIKKISTSTIFELIKNNENGNDDDLKLHRAEVKGNLLTILKKIYPKPVNYFPEIYHFALYTPKGKKADRKTGDKAPRIYFLVGRNSMLYILFYDPYHEINPLAI